MVPAAGVKAGRIVALADDLAITMRATSLRVAPIPGRGAVGVEIANPNPRMVTLRELHRERGMAQFHCGAARSRSVGTCRAAR